MFKLKIAHGEKSIEACGYSIDNVIELHQRANEIAHRTDEIGELPLEFLVRVTSDGNPIAYTVNGAGVQLNPGEKLFLVQVIEEIKSGSS